MWQLVVRETSGHRASSGSRCQPALRPGLPPHLVSPRFRGLHQRGHSGRHVAAGRAAGRRGGAGGRGILRNASRGVGECCAAQLRVTHTLLCSCVHAVVASQHQAHLLGLMSTKARMPPGRSRRLPSWICRGVRAAQRQGQHEQTGQVGEAQRGAQAAADATAAVA